MYENSNANFVWGKPMAETDETPGEMSDGLHGELLHLDSDREPGTRTLGRQNERERQNTDSLLVIYHESIR